MEEILYKKMYHILCGGTNLAIQALDRKDPDFAREALIQAAQDAETLYIGAED